MTLPFWDGLLAGLDYAELEWLELQIQRRKRPLQSEIFKRKTIIRKDD